MIASILITLFRNRVTRETLTLTDADGAAIEFEENDVMRLKIGRAGKTPLLDLDSKAASAGGSSMTEANPSTVVFSATDTGSLKPGTYAAEVSIVDNSDSGRIKHADTGICVVLETQGGDVGLA